MDDSQTWKLIESNFYKHHFQKLLIYINGVYLFLYKKLKNLTRLKKYLSISSFRQIISPGFVASWKWKLYCCLLLTQVIKAIYISPELEQPCSFFHNLYFNVCLEYGKSFFIALKIFDVQFFYTFNNKPFIIWI